MEESQTTAVPNNGASNAEDFQPETQSPQTAPVADVQQQNGLEGQTNSQEFLNENKATQISVPNNPAPAQAQAKADVTGLVIIAVLAIIAGIALFRLSNRIPSKKKDDKPAPAPKTEAVEAEEKTEETATEELVASAKKPTAKKKPAKKSKRRNR